MSRKRQPLTALVLGVLGMVGLAVVATVPADRPAAAAEAGDVQPKPADAGAPDLYARAKQAYKEGQRIQALTDALEAHKKDPQDVRVKYLIYLLRQEQATTAGAGTGTETPAPTVPGGRKAVSISDEEVQALIKEEGTRAIRQFGEIQRILQRRCGNAKCHGATGTGTKWVLALKGLANESMLAENFRTVNQYLNREAPDQSPLLLKPLGGKEAGHPEKAIRGKTDSAYQQILKYIRTLRTATEKPGFFKGGATP